MTTKQWQLRGMIAGEIRLSMKADPANAGLTAKEWRAKFEARVKAEAKGVPGPPHGLMRKIARAVRADRFASAVERHLSAPGKSQRQRKRHRCARKRWHLKND